MRTSRCYIGYVRKGSDPQLLLDAIRATTRGQSMVDLLVITRRPKPKATLNPVLDERLPGEHNPCVTPFRATLRLSSYLAQLHRKKKRCWGNYPTCRMVTVI